MASSLELAGELPFRFWLSPAMAERWDKVPHEVRQRWLTDWATDEFVHDLSELAPSRSQNVQVAVTGALLFVREMCQLQSIAYHDAVSSFGVYVTRKLRKEQPVRGELELTAEWAAATSAVHTLEVPCAAGRIDIVFPQNGLLVESKIAGAWKHALGQALAYRHCLGASYGAALLLLGKRSDPAYDGKLAEAVAKVSDVDVFWYDGQAPASEVAETWRQFICLRQLKASTRL